MTDEKLVSVLLFVEDVEDDLILQAVENIEQQTHKNIDLIISSFNEENSEKIKQKCAEKFLNVRWIHHEPGPNFINEALLKAEGEIVFYKTINNVAWFPRHIESHMEEFSKDPKSMWALSNIENRDIAKINSRFNTVSFRISNPPPIKEICIDEICHKADVECNWIECLVSEDNNQMFYAGYIVKQWNDNNLRGNIPPEITVIQYIETQNNNAGSNNKNKEELYDKIANSIGAPQPIEKEDETVIDDDGNIIINKKFPTYVGNKNFESHNQRNAVIIGDDKDVRSIGIKRTMGMGDVILCEPIIRKMKEKYPQAKINFYTNSEGIVNFFKEKPDNVIKIEPSEILNDYLSKQEDIISYDLDLSYESRENKNFIDSYAEVGNIKFSDDEDKKPSLIYDGERLIKENYVVVCGDGSGWPGKTWPLSYYEDVIEFLLENNYKVIETGFHHTNLTPSEYHECDLDTLINLISNCELYIGADNGPLHIARSFNKKTIAINGAALSYISNPNRDNIYYLQDSSNDNLGLKHRQFFNIRGDSKGITFVPMADNNIECGIRNIKPEHVIECINKIQNKEYELLNFTQESEDIHNMKTFKNADGISLINV